MTKTVRQLLKEAHDFGFYQNTGREVFSVEESFVQFMKLNSLPIISAEEIKQQEAAKAQELINDGFTLREIAAILGISHPQSVKGLIKRYGKAYKKRSTRKTI